MPRRSLTSRRLPLVLPLSQIPRQMPQHSLLSRRSLTSRHSLLSPRSPPLPLPRTHGFPIPRNLRAKLPNFKTSWRKSLSHLHCVQTPTKPRRARCCSLSPVSVEHLSHGHAPSLQTSAIPSGTITLPSKKLFRHCTATVTSLLL